MLSRCCAARKRASSAIERPKPPRYSLVTSWSCRSASSESKWRRLLPGCPRLARPRIDRRRLRCDGLPSRNGGRKRADLPGHALPRRRFGGQAAHCGGERVRIVGRYQERGAAALEEFREPADLRCDDRPCGGERRHQDAAHLDLAIGKQQYVGLLPQRDDLLV